MSQPKGYVLSPELKRAVNQVVLHHLSSFQPRPQTGRRPRGGRGGGTGDGAPRALARAISNIDPAIGSGGSRIPGISGPVDILKSTGDPQSTQWENWSLTPIPADTFLVGIKIGDNVIIVDAFC